MIYLLYFLLFEIHDEIVQKLDMHPVGRTQELEVHLGLVLVLHCLVDYLGTILYRTFAVNYDNW